MVKTLVGVVNIITKSGTSKFHGDLFEYVRNRVFDAHDHFSTTVVNGVLTVKGEKSNAAMITVK